MSTVASDDVIRANIKANLRRILAARGWSQLELARRTGEKQSTINTICNGHHCPQFGVMSRIAEALDVSLARLAATPVEENIQTVS